MKLDDIEVSKAIIESYTAKLIDSLESDVAIVGGGPAGLVAAYYLAKAGKKVTLFERKLAIGGGMWGGGMMFNEIVLQEESKDILDEFGIRSTPVKEGYYCADSVETVATLCSKAVQAGARIFNLVSAEDVMITNGRVTGLVINWTAVGIANLHVDPITIRARCILDASGHPAEIAHIIRRKGCLDLATPTGDIMGERPMCADIGEQMVLENTKEIHDGVFVTGMSANAVFGSPRMGPIFGGMLMGGKKVADLILAKLDSA